MTAVAIAALVFTAMVVVSILIDAWEVGHI